MQCEEFEDRLNSVLDERGRPECDPELRLHIENCPECRHIADCYSRLLDGFCALAAPQLSTNLCARVLAEARRPSQPARRATRALGGLAVAGALVVAALPLWRLSTRDVASRGARPPAGRLTSASAGAARRGTGTVGARQRGSFQLESLPLLHHLSALGANKGDDVYGQLTKGTAHGLAAIVLYVPGIGGSRGIIDVEPNADESDPAWAVQMSEGLRPVTDSVTDTFNLLLKALPVTELASSF